MVYLQLHVLCVAPTALLSTKEPAQQEAALCVAESLIRSRPPDLIEVGSKPGFLL